MSVAECLNKVPSTDFLGDEDENTKIKPYAKYQGCVIINSFRKIFDSNNNPMVFLELEDLSGVFEGVVFASDYEDCKNFIEEGRIVYIKGCASKDVNKSGNRSLVVSKISTVEESLRLKVVTGSVPNIEILEGLLDGAGEIVVITPQETLTAKGSLEEDNINKFREIGAELSLLVKN